MALVATQIDALLQDELDRVGPDPDARFGAFRVAFERFSRTLPLNSNLVQLYKRLDDLIRQMEQDQLKVESSRLQYQAQVHANSSVHYLNKRRDELDARLAAYKESKIDLINLAKEKQTPKIINKYVEEVRSGVKEIPAFIKQLPAHLAGDIDYLTNYQIAINNEVKVKKRLRDSLLESRHDPARVKRLLVTNQAKGVEAGQLKDQAQKWKTARAIKNYMDTMGTTDMKLDDVIQLFTFDQANLDQIEQAVCNPDDKERGLETLRLVKRFDRYIEQDEFQSAAKLAMSSSVFYSVNTLKRLTSKKEGLKSAIWLATILFESDPGYARDDAFVTAALDIVARADLVQEVTPHWHGLGVFHKKRQIADCLSRIGAANFALEIYLDQEAFTEAAHILFEQKKYHHIVHMHEQKHIPHTLMLNKFYQSPNFAIGMALFASGDECLGQIMVNLLSRGLKSDAAKFINHFKPHLQQLIAEDDVTDEVGLFKTQIKYY